MKLDTFDQKVLTNAKDQSDFGMVMNGTAAAIMSDMLYQHKVAAVIREYICNAVDSHINAGKLDVPIRVTLPSHFNSNFIVSDEGVGLNEDEVREIFASYFNSTKTSTNDQTGSFGLGSKSGFSISQSFTVQSWKDGKESLYTCYVGGDWIPKLSKVYSMKSEDPNKTGVTVSIPVDADLFNRFQNEASAIISFINAPVKVAGGIDLISDSVYSQIEKHGYATFDSSCSDLYRVSQVYALMGGVVYPIPSSIYSAIDGFRVAFNWDNGWGRRIGLLIPFDIGELRPAATRESLSLDPATEKNIKDKLTTMVEEILRETQEQIDACDSVFDAIGVVRDAYSNTSDTHGHLFSQMKAFKYKGVPLSTTLRKRVPFFSYGGYNAPDPFKFCSNEFRIHQTPRSIQASSVGSLNYEDLHQLMSMGYSLYAIYDDQESKLSSMYDMCRKYGRDNLNHCDMVIVIESNLSELRKDRINRLFNHQIKWLKFSDVRESQKKERAIRRKRNLNSVTAQTVYAASYTFHRYCPSNNITVDKDNMFAVWNHMIPDDREGMAFERYTEYGFSIRTLLSLLKITHRKHFKIIIANQSNKNKIIKAGVPFIDKKMIDEMIEKNHNAITYCVLERNGFSCRNGELVVPPHARYGRLFSDEMKLVDNDLANWSTEFIQTAQEVELLFNDNVEIKWLGSRMTHRLKDDSLFNRLNELLSYYDRSRDDISLMKALAFCKKNGYDPRTKKGDV